MKKGIALAGVMGGANTEINEQTVDVLIESAYFSPVNIRRTSKLLGLRSESSYRFERGADMGICDWASQRAAQLILETAGGQLAEGVVDVYPKPAQPKEITLHFAKSKDLLGIGISHAEQVSFLTKLGLAMAKQEPGECTFIIPSWRVDLKREVDLIEEVGRLFGVDKIPATPPRGALGANAFDSVYDQIGEARRILTGLGLNEAQGQTLISRRNGGMRSAESVVLANPLSSDMDVLRPSLLPGLIHSLRHNVSRKNYDVALFEIGRVFTDAERPPKEERRVAIALTGQRAQNFWSGDDRDAKFDAFDLKGLVEEFLEHFGVARRGVRKARRKHGDVSGIRRRSTLGGKLPLGELGQLLAGAREEIRFARRGVSGGVEPGSAARAAESGQVVQAAAAIPVHPPRRGDAGAGSRRRTKRCCKRSRQAKPANLETRGVVRRVPRQECAGRAEEPGLRLHLPLAGKDPDRCRCERRARESRGDVKSAIAGASSARRQAYYSAATNGGIGQSSVSAMARRSSASASRITPSAPTVWMQASIKFFLMSGDACAMRLSAASIWLTPHCPLGNKFNSPSSGARR